MRIRTVGIILTVIAVLLMPATGAVAAQEQRGPSGDDGRPSNSDYEPFQNTTSIDNNTSDGVTPGELAGKFRVEDQYVNNTSIELVRNNSENFTVVINITHDSNESVENVSFYLQETALENSMNISNVTAQIDGNDTEFYTGAGPGNSPWVLFEVDSFSERRVTFSASQRQKMPDRGPVDGKPENASSFGSTSPVVKNVDPPQVAGKFRVDSQYSDTMNITVSENTSDTFTVQMEHPNATNVTVYVNKKALSSSLNVSDAKLLIDGQQRKFGQSDANNSTWVVFTVDQFSTKNATFTTVAGGSGGFISGNGPIILGGAALVVILLVGGYLWKYDVLTEGTTEYLD